MWEIIRRYKDSVMWASRDAEGRRIYAATVMGRDGMAIEPSGRNVHHSQGMAWQYYREGPFAESDPIERDHDGPTMLEAYHDNNPDEPAYYRA